MHEEVECTCDEAIALNQMIAIVKIEKSCTCDACEENGSDKEQNKSRIRRKNKGYEKKA